MGNSNKGGAPKKAIDYDMLDKLCAIMCTGEECAEMLGIDYDTLNNRLKEDVSVGFSDYFKRKSTKGKVSLRRSQFLAATEDNSVPMMIWLGKQHLGQTDKSLIDSTSSDGSMSPKGATLDDFYGDSNV